MSHPYLAFNFRVVLLGSSGDLLGVLRTIALTADGGFTEVSGLESSLDTEDYSEGGTNGFVHKFPTRVTWPPLRLRRGLGSADTLWGWYHSFVEGRGQRRDGLVSLLDHRRQPVKAWSFRRGLPTRWAGPTLQASSNQVAVEELEIAHEGLEVVPVGTPGLAEVG